VSKLSLNVNNDNRKKIQENFSWIRSLKRTGLRCGGRGKSEITSALQMCF
jgi:hypothetical protein